MAKMDMRESDNNKREYKKGKKVKMGGDDDENGSEIEYIESV